MIDLRRTDPQNIIITGITGTLGRAVCAKLLRDCGDNVRILGISRDEQKQLAMPKDPRLTVRLGDVRDYESLSYAARTWRGVDVHQIYHFAALKCVDKLEDEPEEAKRTNVEGTANVVKLANEMRLMQSFPRVIMASTDKAAYPINNYGKSKATAEGIVLQDFPYENCVVRYGNVIGSRGSYLEKLMASLLNDKIAEITDPEMTRFWWTIDDARDFVISSGYGELTGIQYPHWIKSATVLDFVKSVAEVINVPVYEIKRIKVRPGEKTHECLATAEETKSYPIMSNDSDRLMNRNELKKLIERALRKGIKL